MWQQNSVVHSREKGDSNSTSDGSECMLMCPSWTNLFFQKVYIGAAEYIYDAKKKVCNGPPELSFKCQDGTGKNKTFIH